MLGAANKARRKHAWGDAEIQGRIAMTKFNTRASGLLGLAVCAGLIGAAALVPGSSRGQVAGGEEWQINPLRGPVDLGLTDPSLVGAIDVHLHVDPDSTGTGGTVRAVDV